MFIMRRCFRRPLIIGFLIVFLWVFVLDDIDYKDEIQEKKSFTSGAHSTSASPDNIRHHEEVEDVIFGQGLLITRSDDRSSQHQDQPILQHKDAAVSVTQETVEDKKYVMKDTNRIDGRFSSNDQHSSDKGKTKKSTYLTRISQYKDQETIMSQAYPVRYRIAINESLDVDQETSNPTNKESSLEKVSGTIKENYKKPPLWMRVTDDIYTYSGFWDPRQKLPEGPVARILGILRYKKEFLHDDASFKWNGNIKEDMLNCSCLLWYEDKEKPQQGILKAFIFEEGRYMFVGTFFLCYPRQNNNTKESDFGSNYAESDASKSTKNNSVPYAVSLLPDNTINAPHKLIYLDYNPKGSVNSQVNSSTTALCVRALFGPYNDIRGMIQFVSYYTTVLKISHFYFYDLAIGPSVSKLIESLRSLGITFDILPWNLPTSEWGEFWDMGSLTALNDCVYRSSSRHTFVAIVDLDEFIVPRTTVNGLGDLYNKVLSFRRGQYGDAVLIPNVFYCYDFKGSDLTVKRNNSFPIFEYTQRETRLWPPKSRTKMVIVPETIVSIGHHMVHNFQTKALENRSSPKLVSVLHHYRACAGVRLGIFATGSKVLDQPTVKDASMMKYKSAIMNSKAMILYKKFLLANS